MNIKGTLRLIRTDGRKTGTNVYTAPSSFPGPNPLESEANVARKAAVTVSSTRRGYSIRGATDALVDGYPGDTTKEWTSNGEAEGAEIRLAWAKEQVIDRVWLFDRPNMIDQVTKGHLTFDDGTTILVGELPNPATSGIEVRFAPKHVRWVTFTVDAAKPGTENIGLAEIGVFTPIIADKAKVPPER